MVNKTEFIEIRKELYQSLHNLMMWCCENVKNDDSGEIRKLLIYVQTKIFALEDDAFMSLIAKVENNKLQREQSV